MSKSARCRSHDAPLSYSLSYRRLLEPHSWRSWLACQCGAGQLVVNVSAPSTCPRVITDVISHLVIQTATMMALELLKFKAMVQSRYRHRRMEKVMMKYCWKKVQVRITKQRLRPRKAVGNSPMAALEVGVTSSRLGSCRLSGGIRAPLYPVIACTFFWRYAADFSLLIKYFVKQTAPERRNITQLHQQHSHSSATPLETHTKFYLLHCDIREGLSRVFSLFPASRYLRDWTNTGNSTLRAYLLRPYSRHQNFDASNMTTAISVKPQGQNHDRLDSINNSSMPSISMEDDLNGLSEPMDITPFQKMVSATTGSLLTGLTSMSL